MKPPSTEDPPPEPAPEPPSRLPPFGQKPAQPCGLTRPEIVVLLAIAAVLAL